MDALPLHQDGFHGDWHRSCARDEVGNFAQDPWRELREIAGSGRPGLAGRSCSRLSEGVAECRETWRTVTLRVHLRSDIPCRFDLAQLGPEVPMSFHDALERLPSAARDRVGTPITRLIRDGGRHSGEGTAHRLPIPEIPRFQLNRPQGHRLPGSRPRRAARVLRLPRPPLDAPSNHQRRRVGLRHDPPPKLASQELRHPKDRALDDPQDGSVRREILATAAWLPTPRQGHRGSPVQRRHRGHRGPQSRRMNNHPYNQI